MKTILLVEDNTDIRENTAEILELAGYTVVTAENGKIGVERALQKRPDLVICDIMMPVLDGYGVLHIFNTNPDLAGIPFIFLTAKTERSDFRKGMELGADDYLTKPFDDTELLSAVEGRLKRYALRSEPGSSGQRSETAPQPPLRSDYDLSRQGLAEFMADARALTGLDALTLDRKVHAVRKKQFVYTEGDEPTRLYFVKAGRVKTFRTNPDGKEFITGLYGPGEFFGYGPLLEQTDHTDSAVTLDDSELYYVPKDQFMALLLRDAAVSRQFVRLLAGRVSEREQQLLGMAYGSLRRRVADTLLMLHGRGPVIQLSRDDLAAMVGTATESLIRTLSEFRHDGLIDISDGGIRVLNPDRLRQMRV